MILLRSLNLNKHVPETMVPVGAGQLYLILFKDKLAQIKHDTTIALVKYLFSILILEFFLFSKFLNWVLIFQILMSKIIFTK